MRAIDPDGTDPKKTKKAKDEEPTLFSSIAKMFGAGAAVADAFSAGKAARTARTISQRFSIADRGAREVAEHGAIAIEKGKTLYEKGKAAAESAKPAIEVLKRELSRKEDRSIVVTAREDAARENAARDQQKSEGR
jgi:hypothetical protein